MATESDNVNSGALGTLLAVGTFATLGIALVVTALVRAESQEEFEKKDVSANRPYLDLRAEQVAKLNAPAAYSDRARGLVSLPLDRAMELTVSGLSKDPNSATPQPPKEEKDAGAEQADAAAADAATPETVEAGSPETPPVEGAVMEAPTERPLVKDALVKDAKKLAVPTAPAASPAPAPAAPKPAPAAAPIPAPTPAPAPPVPATPAPTNGQ